MLKKTVAGIAVTVAFVVGLMMPASAQQTTDAKEDAKKAGQEAKEAAKQSGEAAKDVGKSTAKATKAAAKKTGQVTKDASKEVASGTKKAAKTVKRQVTPDTTQATCKDGTIQTGKTKTTACADHGGVGASK